MFEGILYWFYGWMGNYGLAVIAFTILVRLVLSPFDYKSRVSMRKISKLQPKMQLLQKKYANDREKLNRKMSELYKTERVSPLSGCLPMLLSYPILIIMFNAMRNVANQMAAKQVADFLISGGQSIESYKMEGFLWIKNIFMADSPTHMAMVDVNTLSVIRDPNFWNGIMNTQLADGTNYLSALNACGVLSQPLELFTNENIADQLTVLLDAYKNSQPYMDVSGAAYSMRLLFFNMNFFKEWNGLWILPIMSAASQFLMTKIVGGTQPQPAANDQQAQTQQATGKFMKWFFPIFSLWICASSTAAFALYWVVSNLIAMVTTVGINKYLDSKDKKEIIAGEGIVQ